MSTKRAVIAIVNYQGKILVGKKRSNSPKFLAGKWHFLAENVEEGESDEQALIRGAEEEVGLEIKVRKHLGSHATPSGKEANFYECFALSENLRIGSDLEEAKWINKTEVLEFLKDRRDIWPLEVIEYFNN